jgi:hypothetical protein
LEPNEVLGGVRSIVSEQKVAFEMNDMMLQATRLTRENRLIEATALIQCMLRGETELATTISPRDDIAPIGNMPSIIDADAETVDETQHPYLDPARFAQPHYFRALRDSTYRVDWPSRHGLRGWMQQPAPVSTADIVPEGGKFIEAICTNPGKPALQALHPQPLPGSAASFGRHAARRHSNA